MSPQRTSFLEGRFGADDALGGNMVLDRKQIGVYFQTPESQRVNSCK